MLLRVVTMNAVNMASDHVFKDMLLEVFVACFKLHKDLMFLSLQPVDTLRVNGSCLACNKYETEC